MCKWINFTVSIIITINSNAQVYTNIGQNPASAFPVCGTNTFYQSSVPICNGQTVFSPGCSLYDYTDKNPYYYKFTCFQSGTLFFTINPNTNSDDYDWSLYDVTGRNPNAIYTDASLTVSSNWSGTGGNTGMSNSGNNTFVCAGIGKPKWSTPYSLIAGHNYLLMISHFTNSQSGYALDFSGGTAVITDVTPPGLLNVKTDCDGKILTVKMKKKMLCNSLTATGSEFYVTPGNIPFTAANTVSCSTNFDTDSFQLVLANPLPTGSYTLRVKNGTDGNSMLDYCNNQIPLTDSLRFTFAPAIPTSIDSVAPLSCATDQVNLIFYKKQIKCSSIGADGSDFSISGTYPVSIVGALVSTCSNGTTPIITLKLNQPLYNKGTFTITLKPGSDGNTLIDECDQTSINGVSISFSVKDTVNADYVASTRLGCVTDTINALHPGGNEVNSWKWFINDVPTTSNTNNAQFLFTQFGIKKIKLAISNGFCTDTATQVFDLDNYIKADFTAFNDFCPKDTAQFTSTAEGLRLTHLWNFGDDGSSVAKNATHIYPISLVDKTYNVTYTITNNLGCSNAVTKPINVLKMCGEFVPTAFTPNGDGVNDLFGPMYAVKALNLVFVVYNRWGQKVFETNNWRQHWDGKINNQLAPIGAYVWQMKYVNRDDKKAHLAKGTVVLLR